MILRQLKPNPLPDSKRFEFIIEHVEIVFNPFLFSDQNVILSKYKRFDLSFYTIDGSFFIVYNPNQLISKRFDTKSRILEIFRL